MSYQVSIKRTAMEALFDLRGEPVAIERWLAELGVALPKRPNSVSAKGELSLLWTGPQHWLLRAPLPREAELQELAERIDDYVDISVVLVSDNYAGFELGGTEVRDVLSQATPLDLRPDEFGPGAASFTEFFGITGLLCCTAATEYRVYVERSYVDFVDARLKRAGGGA